MSLDLAKPRRIAQAVDAALRSPAWRAAKSHEDRVWIVTATVSDELSPLVPRAEAVRRELAQRNRDRRIREDFNGTNYCALAARHGLSTRQVRRIVDEPRKAAKVT